jgi:hypothetical protein
MKLEYNIYLTYLKYKDDLPSFQSYVGAFGARTDLGLEELGFYYNLRVLLSAFKESVRGSTGLYFKLRCLDLVTLSDFAQKLQDDTTELVALVYYLNFNSLATTHYLAVPNLRNFSVSSIYLDGFYQDVIKFHEGAITAQQLMRRYPN